MKIISYKKWLEPRENRAKKAGAKLSSKNRERLFRIYISWGLNQYGNTFTTLFKLVYSDKIEELIAFLTFS